MGNILLEDEYDVGVVVNVEWQVRGGAPLSHITAVHHPKATFLYKLSAAR